MTPSVSFEAERELIDGALFYAREANAELGLAFIAEFERAIGVLCNYPRLGPVWRGSTRRFPLRRFPYSIIYQLKPEEVRVIALAHQSRRPGYWRGRK
ncbi:MAG: type II toxin-antitoxin system RelE/ParE family toxin [Burkholderiales bacterium]